MSRCNLKRFPHEILNLKKLEYLDLTRNYIQEIDKEWLKKLQSCEVNLNYNEIEFLELPETTSFDFLLFLRDNH
ncbi:MAG: hypothetical protein ACTSR8_13595 [Promethearchaeota archaeon]